jgi:hypothetical protein
MEKELLKNKEEFDAFIKGNTGLFTGYGRVDKSQYLEEPISYPCVVVYEIQHSNYGPDTLECEYVYPNDFE